jgi:hypothetical protein
MSDSYIQVPADATGKKVDASELTVDDQTVERQRIVIAGAADTDLQVVTDALPDADACGSVVRTPAPSVDTGYGTMSHTGTLASAPNISSSLAFLLDGLWLANVSGAAITVEITDGSSQAIVPTQNLPAGSQLAIACGGKPTTGLKWNAGAGSVYAQAWGRS